MIDREELLELLTTDDIIEILKDLGSDTYKKDIKGNIYFLTVCHGGDSHKLYYFSDSKFFKCFTCCGSMSLYDLIMTVKQVEFKEAFKYVCDFKGISSNNKIRKIGIQKHEVENFDLDFLRLHLYKKEKPLIKLPYYNNFILNLFDDYYPLLWYKEGITDEIAKYFNIRFYINQNKAIIPHYDIDGNLVGIRGRNFFQYELDNKRKYMPVTIEKLTYRYPMGFNLYGIYQNKRNIKKYKRAIIFESEKSVMLYGSYYNQENNIALALCGMTISLYQRDLLLSLEIEEIVIALDKQYQLDYINDENVDKNSKQWKEFENYIKGLIKISEIFKNYINVSIILCWDDRIDYKSAPIDNGKDIFEQLYKERYYINDIEELRSLIL